MSDPIQVGGSYTCKGCGQWFDGSDLHDCSANRPVSVDSGEFARGLEYAAQIVDKWAGQLRNVSHAMAAGAEVTAQEIRALSATTAIDAARPKVSEDDQKVAEELANKFYVRRYEFKEMVIAIASALASVRDAARLAERERIREAVEKLRTMEGTWVAVGYVYKAIDGQPVDGGGDGQSLKR